jgi:hypothetical protein
MAVQAVIGLRAALCMAVVTLLLPAASAVADDIAPAKTGVAKPSVEELAAQRPADNARETPARRCA